MAAPTSSTAKRILIEVFIGLIAGFELSPEAEEKADGEEHEESADPKGSAESRENAAHRD